MRNIILSLIFLVSCFANTQAQTTAQETVFLTNQSSYSGIVVEQKPGEYIRLLRVPELDTLQFHMDSIERVVRITAPAPVAAEDALPPTEPHKRFNQNPHIVMLHGYVGGGDYSLGGFGVTFSHNLHNRWWVGLGAHYIGQTGSYNATYPDRQIVPITADLRWNFSQSGSGRFVSMLALNAGYYFGLNNRYRDENLGIEVHARNGLFFNPSVAFRANVLPNAGLMLDLGYQLTTSSLFDTGNDTLIKRKQWHNFALRGTVFF